MESETDEYKRQMLEMQLRQALGAQQSSLMKQQAAAMQGAGNLIINSGSPPWQNQYQHTQVAQGAQLGSMPHPVSAKQLFQKLLKRPIPHYFETAASDLYARPVSRHTYLLFSNGMLDAEFDLFDCVPDMVEMFNNT